MTFKKALDWGKTELLKAGILEGVWDAEQLLLYVSDCDRTKLLLYGREILPREQEQAYRLFIEKRKEHVPLQYLTGEQEFMGLPFYVNQNVLIPRQDTECLVETVLRLLEEMDSHRRKEAAEKPERAGKAGESEREREKIRVLDMCTGSGCIGISIGKLAGKKEKGTVEVVCSDVSAEALEVAKQNGLRNGVEITWIESDLFTDISGRFHVIVSNPPYITKEEMKGLMPEVRLFEPERALYGREDGLYFYREIIRQAPEYLEKNGMLFFEIGCSQGGDVSALMEQAGFQDIRIEKDLAGLNRIVYGRI